VTSRLVVRLARSLTLAILIGYLAYTLASWFLAWNPADGGAYYDAAERLVNGQPPYAPVNPEAHEVYRYAPWFAVLWIPLTLLPRDLVLHAWSLVMLACAAAAVWPLLRRPSWASIALAALVGQTLAETAMFGNVQPLLVAVLAWTALRRSFPVWVGVTASLKLVPLAFVLVWLPRGRWRPAAVALGVFVALMAPMLFFDLSSYVTDPGTGLLSFYSVSPALWLAAAAAIAAVTVWLAIRRSPWAWIAAAVLMYFALPRVVTSYIAFLIPGYLLAANEIHWRSRGE
jgi:alpha-1,2-mannosyltransferase